MEVILASCGQETLLAAIKEDGTVGQYIVGWDYDPTKPDGRRWDNGTYFPKDMLSSAVDFLYNRKITYDRMAELATLFKDELMENSEENTYDGLLDNCDLNETECDFFELARM